MCFDTKHNNCLTLFFLLLTNSCHKTSLALKKIQNMSTTTNTMSANQLLVHWQGHRNVTRKTIEAFPEKELFEFTIGGMRPFSEMIIELLSIGATALKQIVEKDKSSAFVKTVTPVTKTEILKEWDLETGRINTYFARIPQDRFQEKFNLFGEYNFPIYENILYFIDNEVHHRAQAYVYLRAIGIEPPFFWIR